MKSLSRFELRALVALVALVAAPGCAPTRDASANEPPAAWRQTRTIPARDDDACPWAGERVVQGAEEAQRDCHCVPVLPSGELRWYCHPRVYLE